MYGYPVLPEEILAHISSFLIDTTNIFTTLVTLSKGVYKYSHSHIRQHKVYRTINHIKSKKTVLTEELQKGNSYYSPYMSHPYTFEQSKMICKSLVESNPLNILYG